MPESSLLTTRAPYHITLYGLLTGSQFFQSFVGGIIAFKTLTRPQFSQLQQKTFPIYFGLQTALPVLLAFTYPESNLLGTASGISGALADTWGTFIPLATVFVSSALNLGVVGPATTRTLRERKVQETRDGKKYTDPAPHSVEMKRLNSAFGRLHGISTLLNLAGFSGTLWYGVNLAARIQ